MIKGADIIYDENVKANVLKKWKEILDSGWVILGKHTKEFEKVCADYFGKMIVPANGFFSIVTALDRAGGEPYFLDIDIDNGVNFTINEVERALRVDERIKAVCIMSCGGLVPADTMEIVEICREYGVYILGDNAHAHGVQVDGVKVGSYEDFACFSFYATKVVNTAEGGILLVDDKRFEKEAKCLRNYGRGGDFGSSTIVMDGNNWRMTEFTAALGVEQMKKINKMLEERKKVAKMYDEKFKDVKNAQPIKIPDNVSTNYYKYIVLLEKGIDKQKVKAEMLKREIEMSGDVYDLPIVEQPIYRDRYNANFPQAKEFSKRHVCMPFHEGMTQKEVDTVMAHFRDVLEEL